MKSLASEAGNRQITEQFFMHRTICNYFVPLLLVGCATESAHFADVGRAVLAYGDCVAIDFVIDSVRREDLRASLVVDEAGDISLPLLGKLRVAGLTLEQTQGLIEREFGSHGTPALRSRSFVVSRCK